MKPEILTGPIATESMTSCNLHTCTKEQILEFLENAYALDEWLYTSIKDEEFFCKSPDRLRLPLIFYYAHTAVFYVNKLLLVGMIKERVDRHFEGTFEMGFDEMSWDDTENYRMGGAYQWPSIVEVRAYRLKVREMVRKVIEETPLQLPITKESKWWAILMGIEHQRIHLETSSVLIRQLPVGMVEKPIGWKYGPMTSDLKENPMVEAGDEDVLLGNEFTSHVWCWDNEYGRREFRVPKFEASKHLITNGEFLKFVQDGGYERQNYWSEEGWRWVNSTQSRHPTFWVCSKRCKSVCGSNLGSYSHCNIDEGTEDYRLRLMFDVVPLPRDWPVEVNYLEAKAFCAWKGAGFRLPTEAEHCVMRGEKPLDPTRDETGNHNSNMAYGSPTPVGMYPPSTSGYCDVFGNVWEWVEDDFNGLTGSESHYLYADYSEPFYDGKHTIMMGSSWATTGYGRGQYTRFGFRRHFFHVGFRVARTLDFADPSPAVYVKTDVYVSGYGEQKNVIDFSSPDKLGIKPVLTKSAAQTICDDTEENLVTLIKNQYFSKSSVQNILNGRSQGKKERALVIGCGTGSSAFELSTIFDEVVACDVSGRCIDFVTKLSEQRSLCYPLCIDNGNVGETEIRIPEGSDPSKVAFKQWNWVPVEVGRFDFVLIDDARRLPNKRAWLAMLPDLIKTPESVVVIKDHNQKAREIWNDIVHSNGTNISVKFSDISG